MRISTQKIGLLILTLMSLSFIIFFYGDILIAPNNYMFSYVGDALKNYANFKYHIQYDASFASYNGVFYPYGESIMFTDIHPIIVSFHKLLSLVLPSIGYYSVGIINLQILLSFVLTSIILYLVFIKLKVSEFTAIFGAFSISVLSSHILLLEYGHWALSYAWAVPLAWLLLINFIEKKAKLKWSLFIAANTLFWFLTHGYQGLSTLLFTASVFLALLMFKLRNKQKMLLYLKHFAIQVILPVFVYYILILSLDKHSQRIDMPFTTAYISDINFVISPNFSILKPIYYFFYNFSLNELSWRVIGNYIGFTTIITLLIFIISIKKNMYILKQSNIIVYITASIIVLLYSFGIPFKYNLQYILDYIPAIKQFTGLGRFAWVFYFVISVFAFYFIDKTIKNTKAKYILIFISAFILTLEGAAYHNKISKSILNPNILKQENIPAVYKNILDIDVTKYQAVITLPYFIKYGCPYVPSFSEKAGYFYSILPSLTGLPTLNAVLSRPAIDESRKLVQIFSPSNYLKDIKSDFKSDKPFLVLHTKDKLVKQEQAFLNKCKLIDSTKNYDIFEIDFNNIFDFNPAPIFNNYTKIKDSLLVSNNLLLSDSSFIYFDNFDNMLNDTNLFGGGVYSKPKLDSTEIFKINCNKFEVDKEYNLSFWYYNTGYNQAFTFIKLMVKDSTQTYSLDPLHTEIIYGNWNYVEFEFKIADNNGYLFMNNESNIPFSDNKLYIDNLLIREKTVEVYQEVGDSILLINNNIFKK